MPSIASRLLDPSQIHLMDRPSSGAVPILHPPLPHPAPGMSTMLRCPMPNLSTPSPDNLRQFYVGGSIPQYRIVPPTPLH